MTGATATESTRDQIIHAAADSLLENGYSGTSVRAIATKAGVAIGNLQYWFPTKSELLVEAWRYLTARSVQELRRTLNQLTDPLEVLEIGVESLWDSLRRLGDIQLAAFDLLVQAPRTERLRAYLPELTASKKTAGSGSRYLATSSCRSSSILFWASASTTW